MTNVHFVSQSIYQNPNIIIDYK